MKKIISFFGLFVTVVFFAALTPEFAGAYTREYTYTYDSIPNRTIKYELIDYNNFLELTINDTKYTIINSEYEVYNAFCDKSGTIWANLLGTSGKLYLGFYNFELQGDKDLTFHSIRSGIVEPDSEWIAIYGYDDKPECYWTLPTVEELSNFLSTGELALNYIPNPYTNPTPIPTTTNPNPPEETSTPSISSKPTSTPELKPSSVPTTQPSSVPVVQSSSNPTIQPTQLPSVQTNETPVIKKKQLKSKIQLTYILGNDSKVITLSKSGILKYKKSAIKKIKDATFTETGDIIYLKKNGDAYYVSNSKIKFLRHKVKSIKKKTNFAISLKLKNGKTVKLKI